MPTSVKQRETRARYSRERYNDRFEYDNMYSYSSTSTAPEFPPLYPEIKRPERRTSGTSEAQKRKNRAQRSRRSRTAVIDKKTLVKAAVGFVIFFALCVSVVYRYSMILTYNQEIKKLEKKCEEMISANQVMQSKIEQQLQADEIEKYAEKNLGMMKPETSQIFYVDIRMQDSGIGEKALKDNEMQRAVSGTPGMLINAFRVLK